MVLLTEIPLDELRAIPSKLLSNPVDSSDHCVFLFDVIGRVKDFDGKKVFLDRFTFMI